MMGGREKERGKTRDEGEKQFNKASWHILDRLKLLVVAVEVW